MKLNEIESTHKELIAEATKETGTFVGVKFTDESCDKLITMMDKMGLDMNELSNVQEVIIKTDKKEIIISKPSVTEMKAKDNSIFTVTADSYEERELEVPIFSEEDIQLVSQQAEIGRAHV